MFRRDLLILAFLLFRYRIKDSVMAATLRVHKRVIIHRLIRETTRMLLVKHTRLYLFGCILMSSRPLNFVSRDICVLCMYGLCFCLKNGQGE